MDIVFFNEAQKMWDKFSKDGMVKDHDFELQLQKKILDIFHVGNFYYYIFDLKSVSFRYISPDINKVLGYDANDVDLSFFLSKIHPDDQAIFLNHENTAADFFRKLPLEKIAKYKVSYDYRIFNSSGEIVRILQQVVTIQHDDDKNILLTLGVHTDISHLKTTNKSTLSFIGLEGEPSYINVEVKEVYKPSKGIFTKKEKEIIYYLIKGERSYEIAKTLFISVHTVNSHRKNILAKTNTRNTLELAVKVISEGLI